MSLKDYKNKKIKSKSSVIKKSTTKKVQRSHQKVLKANTQTQRASTPPKGKAPGRTMAKKLLLKKIEKNIFKIKQIMKNMVSMYKFEKKKGVQKSSTETSADGDQEEKEDIVKDP